MVSATWLKHSWLRFRGRVWLVWGYCVDHRISHVIAGFFLLHLLIIGMSYLAMRLAGVSDEDAWVLALTSDSSLGYRDDHPGSVAAQRIADVEAIVGMMANSVGVSIAVAFLIRPRAPWRVARYFVFDPDVHRWIVPIECGRVLSVTDPSVEISWRGIDSRTRWPRLASEELAPIWDPYTTVEVRSEFVPIEPPTELATNGQLLLTDGLRDVREIVVRVAGRVGSNGQQVESIHRFAPSSRHVRCGKVTWPHRRARLTMTKRERCSTCDHFAPGCGLYQWMSK